MKKHSALVVAVVAMLILVLGVASCAPAAPAATPTPAKAPATTTPPKEAPAPTKEAAAPPKEARKEPYKVGGTMSITGVPYGASMKKSMDLALEALNKKGGINGTPLEAVMYDDQGKPEISLENIKKSVNQDKVIFLTGLNCTSCTGAVAPWIQDQKVPQESQGSGYRIDPKKETYLFKTTPDVWAQLESLLQLTKNKGMTKVALMISNDVWGEVSKAEVTRLAPKYGLTIVGEEKWKAAEDKDVTVQLIKLKALNPDIVIAWSTGAPSAIVAKNAVQVGLKAPVVVSQGNADFNWLKLVADLPDGTVIVPGNRIMFYDTVESSDPIYPQMKEFYDAYKAKYGEAPDFMGAAAWDNVFMVAEALKAAGTDREKLRNALEGFRNYKGAGGIYTRSPEEHVGIGPDSIPPMTNKGGKFARYQ